MEEKLFEVEGDIYFFLRKGSVHQLTPKGRHWELAKGSLNLRSSGLAMDEVEYEDEALVLDWVVIENYFSIVLIYNGKEEMGFVLGTVTMCFVSVLFAHILVQKFLELTDRWTSPYASICRHICGRTFPATRSTVLATSKSLAIAQWPRNPSITITFSPPSTD